MLSMLSFHFLIYFMVCLVHELFKSMLINIHKFYVFCDFIIIFLLISNFIIVLKEDTFHILF